MFPDFYNRINSASRNHTQTLPPEIPRVTLRLKLPFPNPRPTQSDLNLSHRSISENAASRLNVLKSHLFQGSLKSSASELTACDTSAEAPEYDEVVQYGQKLLSELEGQKSVVRIPFEYQKRERFIAWFAKHALHHKDSVLIVASFNEKDWKYLQKHLKKDLTGHEPSLLVMKWMTSIAERLKAGTLKSNNDFSILNHDSRIWLFYQYASNFIKDEKTPHSSIDEQCRLLSEALTEENLYQYLDAFSESHLAQQIVRNILLHEPSKLMAWIRLIMRKSYIDSDCRTSEKIAEIFDCIYKAGFIDKAIEVIFDKKNDPVDTLTIYCSLNKEFRSKILNHLFADKNEWIHSLLAWIGKILFRDNLQKFVKDEFSKDFYFLSHEIDPTAADELKKRWQSANFSPSQERYLDCLLPTCPDLTDKNARQDLAIKKLQQHFLTPGISHDDRRKFVGHLLVDLMGDKNAATPWLRTLFNRLPVETWPLIFLHFGHAISHSIYFSYAEEKTKGGIFLTVNKNSEAKGFNWIPDAGEWIDLAAKTLKEIYNNPYLKDPGQDFGHQTAWALQCWYQAVCKSNAIHPVITRFIETDRHFHLIPLMNKLAHSSFYYSRDGFRSLMKDCFDKANIPKTDYIAKCLYIQAERRLNERPGLRVSGVFDLEQELWDILKSHQERSDVAKQLFKAAGNGFVSYFASVYNYGHAALIIQSLKEADPKFSEQLFIDWIKFLGVSTTPSNLKMIVFQKTCQAYSSAGYDVIELLEKEPLKDTLPRLKEWYRSVDCSIELHFSGLGLDLLHYFNSENFYSTILQRIESLFSQEHISFLDFNFLFENLKNSRNKEPIIKKMLEEQPKALALIKEGCKKDLAEYFSSPCLETFPLVSQLIPDWKERLAAWAKDQIKIDKEKAQKHGLEPHYLQIQVLYRSLQQQGFSESWKACLKKELSPELYAEILQAINTQKSKL